jgi:Raf kinase inhibitor-like YbhB/YbcL family protein
MLRKMGAVESRNDFDIDGYGGPCPPPGKPHRYVITVYALDSSVLDVSQGRPALVFEHEIRTATLATTQLVVTFGR